MKIDKIDKEYHVLMSAEFGPFKIDSCIYKDSGGGFSTGNIEVSVRESFNVGDRDKFRVQSKAEAHQLKLIREVESSIKESILNIKS